MCKAPLARCERLGDTYLNKQGKISHNCDFISWADVERNLEYYEMKYNKVDMIPCGKCWECRLQKTRDKATQMMLEKKSYTEDQCWFVTLTYNDENIKFCKTVNTETGEIHEGVSVCKEDAQKFIKKLRMYYKRKHDVEGIRYVIASEYGEQTHRPHMHAILFGLPLDQTKLKKIGINEHGQPLWTHPEIEKEWGMGNVQIGRVTWESCAYVAGYIMKKQFGKQAWYYGAMGSMPEFMLFSKKPPLGSKYLQENMESIMLTDTVPIANKKTLQLVTPPKSFDNVIQKLYPEEFEEIKKKRKKVAQENQIIKNQQTDLTPQQQRENHEEHLRKTMKAMKTKI